MQALPSSSRDTLTRTLPLAAIVVSGVCCWLAFHLYTGLRLEDALITWRYARHLASGDGFVFNLGERVLGTTSPLLTLLLGAAGVVIGVDRIPLAASLLMMTAAAGAAVMTCLAVEKLGCGRAPALAATGALVVHPQMLWMASGGMETPLVLFFMAASLWAIAARRPIAAAVLAALLVLTRIDGILWASGVLICLRVEEAWPVLRRAAVAASLVLGPWVVFAWMYFGSPIPNSLVAKRVFAAGWEFANPAHVRDFLGWVRPFLAWAFPPMVWVGGLAFLAGAARLLLVKPAAASMRLLVVFPLLFCVALYFGRAPIWFDWYLAPVGYCSLIVGMVGVWPLVESVTTRPQWRRVAGGACLAAWAALMLSHGRYTARMNRDYQINEEGTRRVIGEWLRDNTPASAVVAMEAVGYQGYYSDRSVIDLAGVVSPRVVAIRRSSRSNAESFYRVLRELGPDFVVLRSFEVDLNDHYEGGPLFESREQAAFFHGHFDEARRFTAPLPQVWGRAASLTIYRRLPDVPLVRAYQ